MTQEREFEPEKKKRGQPEFAQMIHAAPAYAMLPIPEILRDLEPDNKHESLRERYLSKKYICPPTILTRE
jgi:hypothetical protein